MSKFPKYGLTKRQIMGIANIVLHEQGTIAGWFAEASQIANRTDIKGDKYATPERAVKTVCSGWYAKGRTRYYSGTSNKTVIDIVERVFNQGLRTLPRYVDEHDCMSDIGSVKNGSTNVRGDKSKWIPHKTVIHNHMSSTYTFYDFPGGYKTGVDPFGYTSKANREKWGDFCYTVAEARGKAEKKEEKKETKPTKTETELRDSVVNTLVMLKGIKEGSQEHKMIIDTFNKSGLCTRYKMTTKDAWCATAVSFAFITAKQAGKPGSGSLFECVECSCQKMIELAKKQGIWHEGDNYKPSRGDVILYDWQDSGVGDNKGTPDHVGIIEKVSGDSFTVIEGNYNDSVKSRNVKKDGRYIRGFILPDYAKHSIPSQNPRESTEKAVKVTYYKKYTKGSSSFVDALKAVGEKDTTFSHRTAIAKANGITNYKGTVEQNIKLLSLLKSGKLKKI